MVGNFTFDPKSASNPFCAAIPGEIYLIYIPKDSMEHQVTATNLTPNADGKGYRARWFNPKTEMGFTEARETKQDADVGDEIKTELDQS